ncbi:conjugal transfer protein TraH, partial [bacterium]|nr:conjugal transfer protein TraH [bacterium]
MKFNTKPLILAVILSAITATTQAKIEHKMDAMWRITSASVHKNGVNGAYQASLGGFSTRSPIQNINIYSFDPPHFKAGCGGIDAQFGSFSLISRDQIEQVVRAVMDNMKGYAIKLAINKICPDCLGVLNNLEKLGTDLSSGMKNTCELSEAAVDWMANAVNIKEATNNHKNNSMSDYGSVKKSQADGNKLRGTPGNTAHDWAQYGNSLLNTMFSAKAFDSQYIDTSVYGGDRQFFEIAMSLVGTTIVRTKDKDLADEYIEPIWTLDNFIYGAKPTHKLGILQCDTWGGIEDCQKVKTAELESSKSDIKWRGTYRYALELLIGEQDETTFSQGRYRIVPNSLVDKLRKDASAGNLLFTERQYDFWVNSSLISPQAKVALNETAIRQSDEITILVAQMIAKEVARQMGAEYAGSL